MAGGYRQLIAIPVLKIAGWTYSFDKVLLDFVLGIGNTGFKVAGWTYSFDRILLGFVQGIGNTSIKISGINGSFDHHLLEGVINIGKGIKQAGGAGKADRRGCAHGSVSLLAWTWCVSIRGIVIRQGTKSVKLSCHFERFGKRRDNRTRFNRRDG